MSEARKAKRREKRHLKRQEVTRRRGAEGPQGPRMGRDRGGTQSHTMAEPGPATRTRAKTRATAEVPRSQPPSPTLEVRIETSRSPQRAGGLRVERKAGGRPIGHGPAAIAHTRKPRPDPPLPPQAIRGVGRHQREGDNHHYNTATTRDASEGTTTCHQKIP